MRASVPALHADGLTKYYGSIRGIEDLDLTVERGETFGFLGANGSGKTTTIRLTLDLLHATRGRVLVDGLDSRRDSVKVRQRIGYLPAEMPVYPEMSGRAYLSFLAGLQRPAPPALWLEVLFHRFGVRDVDLSRPIRDLSHGTKRKLGIIQALMGKAPLLILDEPTSGLDPLMIEAFAETITELHAAGCTTFLSSHVLAEVEKLCDRVALVSRGRLVQVATLQDVRNTMPRRVRVGFSRPVNMAPPSLPGVRVVNTTPMEWQLEATGPAGALVESLAGLPLHDVDVQAATLEEYILRLYAAGDA
jgi:ABC-2 type transport system ATP-binding protein